MGTGCWYFALHLLKTFVCLVWSKTPQSIWSIPIFVSKTSLLYFPKVKLLLCDRISLVFLRDCIINLYYMIYCSVWKTFAKPFRLHRFALLLLELQKLLPSPNNFFDEPNWMIPWDTDKRTWKKKDSDDVWTNHIQAFISMKNLY